MPVGVGPKGGARVSEGSEQDDKIIRLALGDDDNENAFQQNVGMGAGMVFDVSDVMVRAKVVTRMRSIFRRFEAQKRYRLREDTIRWKQSGGDLVLYFAYINLESDQSKDFSMKLNAASGGDL
jgi:hypothetical protein